MHTLRAKEEGLPMGKRATTGTSIAGLAAVIVIVGFFLPWIAVSCDSQPLLVLTGDQLARGGVFETELGQETDNMPGSPLLFVTLGSAIVIFSILVVLFITGRARDVLGVLQLVLGALGSLAMLLALLKLKQGWNTEGIGLGSGSGLVVRLRYGFWLTTAGLASVIAGGIVSLADFVRRGRAGQDVTDQLARLTTLYREGALTEREYQAAKSRLLSRK